MLKESIIRKKQAAIIIALMLAVLFFALETAKSSADKMTFSGKDIYRLNCAGCHGADRNGYSKIYPSLLNIRERLSKEAVLEQINNGKGQMPPFSHLTPEEKNALIAFLFEEKEDTVESSIENLGERIFMSNCASCHRATVNDPRPPNIRMMEPAPLAGATKRFTKDEFFRILETGVCYMPSFSHFTLEERESLYSYVKSLEGKGEPSRPTMGEMCPMMRRGRGH
jgi:mono/diheme cytochrome c family protein